jgi:hypothetical protein
MVALANLPARHDSAITMVASAPAPAPAPAAKPAPDFDEEATTAPAELLDEPASVPDKSLLLVKGVPQ